MDQDAFRNILASGSGSGSTKSKSRGVLGGHAPKRGGWGIKAKPGHEYKPPADELKPSTTFAPRNTKKKDPTAGKYVDRAELRRQGKDDEYRPVEQLLEDLEKRQKQEGFDKEEIDKQRAYLGGDATHSILVKGLDHALLAKTRAELAAKGEEVADEELEAIALGAKAQKKTTEPPNAEEKAAKGFKSISAKDDKKESSGVNGEKKKKKKKKVKQEEVHAGLKESVKKPIEAEKPVESTLEAGPSRVMKKEPTPPPVDDDDDIFGDAGDYDLKAGREDEDDSSDEEGEEQEDVDGKEDITVKRSRSRSRSLDRDYRRRTDSGERYDGRRDVDARYNRRDRSYSRERHDRRERSYSRERYDDRRRYSSRADGYDDYDRRSRYQRSPSRERYSDRRRDGSYSRDRFDDRRDRGYQRSPSPRRASHKEYSPPRKHSRSPSPPAKRPRQKTRSPSPITFDFTGRPPSPTPSAESDDDHLVGGKLQPLKSSAISDVKGYLSLDAEAAKEDEKRARKAKWRARQGLGVQEGAEKFLEREVGDKEKMNRDYVNVMNKIKKDEKE